MGAWTPRQGLSSSFRSGSNFLAGNAAPVVTPVGGLERANRVEVALAVRDRRPDDLGEGLQLHHVHLVGDHCFEVLASESVGVVGTEESDPRSVC